MSFSRLNYQFICFLFRRQKRWRWTCMTQPKRHLSWRNRTSACSDSSMINTNCSERWVYFTQSVYKHLESTLSTQNQTFDNPIPISTEFMCLKRYLLVLIELLKGIKHVEMFYPFCKIKNQLAKQFLPLNISPE